MSQMRNRQSLRAFEPAQPAEPTVVVDGLLLVDEATIGSHRIRLLMREAESSGSGSVARLCWAALNEPRHGGRCRGEVAKLWNDRIAAGTEPSGQQLDEEGEFYEPDEGGKFHDLMQDAIDRLSSPLRSRSIANEADPDDEQTTTRPLVLSLVEFNCPYCHHPVVASDERGMLRIPWHRTHEPIFPFGLGGPPYRAECPASLMEITQICDGQHGASPCDDPQCWRRDPPEVSASASASVVDDDRTDEDVDRAISSREYWGLSERTTSAPAYVDRMEYLPVPSGEPADSPRRASPRATDREEIA